MDGMDARSKTGSLLPTLTEPSDLVFSQTALVIIMQFTQLLLPISNYADVVYQNTYDSYLQRLCRFVLRWQNQTQSTQGDNATGFNCKISGFYFQSK